MSTDVKIRLSVDGDAQVQGAMAGIEQRLGGIVKGAALLAAIPAFGALVSNSISAADAVTTLNNSLKLATGSTQAAAAASEELYQIAQRSRTSFTELASTYSSIARAGQALGLTQARTLKVTEAIGNAMAISGGSAEGMKAALLQLGQGMASGVLRGEELNSVMEQSPRLAQALADGLGVPLGSLRKLGEAGALTSEKVIGALEKAGPQLAKEVQGATMTVSQAFTVLGNATTKFIGDADAATGASSTLASAMQSLSNGIDTVGGVIRNNQTAFAILGGLAGGAAAAAGIIAIGGALGTVGTAVAALGVVMAANPVVLTLLGIGAAAGAAIAVGRAYSKTADGIKDSIGALEQANERSAAALTRAVGPDAQANIRKTIEDRKNQIKGLTAELALLGNASLDTRNEDARLAAASAKAGQAAKDRADGESYLTDVRMKLSGVEKDYYATLERMQDLRAKGLIGEKEYSQILSELATKTYKATDADKAAKQAAEQAAAARKAAAKQAEAAATAGALVADSLLAQSASLSAEFLGKWNQLNLAYAGGKIKIDNLTDAQRALLDLQPFVKDAIKQEADQRKRAAEFLGKHEDAARKSADTVRDALKQQLERNDTIGLEAGALVGVEYARAQANIKLLEENLFNERIVGSSPARLQALQDEIELKKQLADAQYAGGVKQVAVDASKAAMSDAKQFFDQMGQSLSDALMKGGKSAGEYIKGLFRNMVLRPILQAVLAPTAGAVGSFVGIGNASASTGGSGGSGSSFGNMLGMLKSAGNLGDKAAFAAEDVGAWLMKNTSGSLNQAGGWLQANSGAIGTAGAYAGGAAVGIYGGRAISGGYGGNAAVNVGTAIGAAIAGPLGAAVGGMIGGLANRAFGRKGPEATAITGTLGDGSQVSTQMTAKGGWFRSDKQWTEKLDTATSGALVGAFDALKTQAGEFATALGGPADTIKGYTAAVNIAIGKDAAANEKAITKFITDQADKLAELAVAGLGEFSRAGETSSQTAQRLAVSLTTVNEAFLAMGRQLLPLSAASGELASKIAEAFGGTSQFSSAVGAYFQAIYTDAEQLTASQSALSAAFTKLGQTLPTTAAGYRTLVEAQDLTTEGGRSMYASLVQLAPAFAEITKAAGEAGAEAAQAAVELAASLAADIASQRADLESQLLNAQGDTNAIRAAELAKLDASNRAIQERIWQLEDEKASMEALSSAGQGIVAFINELRGVGSAGQTVDQLRGSYQSMLAGAQTGDTTASGAIASVASALVDQIRATATDPLALARETARIASQLQALPAAMAYETSNLPAFAVAADVPVAISQTATAQEQAQSALLTELQALRAEVAGLRAEQSAASASISAGVTRTAAILSNVTPDGDSIATRAAA